MSISCHAVLELQIQIRLRRSTPHRLDGVTACLVGVGGGASACRWKGCCRGICWLGGCGGGVGGRGSSWSPVVVPAWNMRGKRWQGRQCPAGDQSSPPSTNQGTVPPSGSYPWCQILRASYATQLPATGKGRPSVGRLGRGGTGTPRVRRHSMLLGYPGVGRAITG